MIKNKNINKWCCMKNLLALALVASFSGTCLAMAPEQKSVKELKEYFIMTNNIFLQCD